MTRYVKWHRPRSRSRQRKTRKETKRQSRSQFRPAAGRIRFIEYNGPNRGHCQRDALVFLAGHVSKDFRSLGVNDESFLHCTFRLWSDTPCHQLQSVCSGYHQPISSGAGAGGSSGAGGIARCPSRKRRGSRSDGSHSRIRFCKDGCSSK